MGWAIGGSGSRSLLVARLTEIVTTAALSAVTGLVNELMPPAMKQLKRQAAAKFFSLLPDVVVHSAFVRVWVAVASIRNSVQYQQTQKYGRQR